jgi:hypothetical protein
VIASPEYEVIVIIASDRRERGNLDLEISRRRSAPRNDSE